ncbi:MAG TPA: hypothetical protein PLV75_03475 [Saprospiraceae bacterium]|nr:hypothetical protein [Saprospiraceae bacterium]
MQEKETIEAYIPGQCNIGPGEIRKRNRIGFIGLALMIVFLIGAEFYQIPKGWKLLLFAPTAYALSGFIQARHKFCFVFGYFGLFSTTGKRTRVIDPIQLRQDRLKALKIVGQIFLGSLMITLLYYFLS